VKAVALGTLRGILTVVLIILIIIDLSIALYSVFQGPIPVRVTLGTPMAYKNIYLSENNEGNIFKFAFLP